MTHIAPLATVGRTHHDRVGGKGANLGELSGPACRYRTGS